jgi:hypothetical protein
MPQEVSKSIYSLHSPAPWQDEHLRRHREPELPICDCTMESRNSVLERLGLKRMPVHGLASCHVTVLQGDFVANQRTLVRLIREATALG